MLFRFIAFVCIGVVFMGHSASARQIDYKRYEGNGVTRFHYKWIDNNNKEQRLKFALPFDEIMSGSKEFKRFDMQEVRMHTSKALRKYARQFPDVDVRVRQRGDRIEIQVSGRVSQKRLQEVVDRVGQQKETIMDNYLSDRFYKEVDEEFIMPDHGKIAQRYVSAMQPVARAMAGYITPNNKRKTMNYMLSFWQSIPYDTLTDRYRTNGAGFQTPYGVISGNRGDCDSKAVAFASLVRNVYPRARLFMIYIDKHALIAAEFPTKHQDMRLTIDGASLVLMEPVGPAIVGVGTISEESKAALASGQYSFQEIPF